VLFYRVVSDSLQKAVKLLLPAKKAEPIVQARDRDEPVGALRRVPESAEAKKLSIPVKSFTEVR
jgi:hypothetical protein